MTPHEALMLAYKRLDDGLIDTSDGDMWESLSDDWDANYHVDNEGEEIKVAVYRVIQGNEGGMTDPNDYYTKETI